MLLKISLIMDFWRLEADIMKNKLIFQKKRGIQKCYLNYLDLLMPYNGLLTAHQYIIISRILDIESFLGGGYFFWQRRITLLDGLEKLSNMDLERLDERFYDLLTSLKEKGFDPSIDNIVISRHPVELLNGTHRLAWLALFDKKIQIPCVSVEDYSIFPVDGFQWLKCINLPEKEIFFIKERYDRLLAENNHYLLAIANINIYHKLKEEIKRYFMICDEKKDITISVDVKSKLIKTEWKNDSIYKIVEGRVSLFYLKLNNQLLIMENGRVKSAVISALIRRLDIIDGLKGEYWIAHTISESIRILDIIRP